MNSRLLYYAPRILGIGGILFISLFALDVFGQGYSVVDTIIGLTIHLIPSMILLGTLMIAWKYEFIGGMLFIALSAIPFMFLDNVLVANLALSVPFFLTGCLFVMHHRRGVQARRR